MAYAARHAVPREPLDPRPQRSGEDDRGEEERDDEPRLPDAEGC